MTLPMTSSMGLPSQDCLNRVKSFQLPDLLWLLSLMHIFL